VPALVLEDRATDAALRSAAYLTNWVVWLAFCGEFLLKRVAAPRRAVFVREAWFDLAIIVLSPPFLVPQQMDSLRALRAVRLFRFLVTVQGTGRFESSEATG